MKKLLNKISTILFAALIFSIFLNTSAAYADDQHLEIGDFIVNSEILKNGDMKNNETISFNFSGYYNGVTRQIMTIENSAIEKISVAQLKDGNAVPYKLVESASKGDKGVFVIQKKNPQDYTLWIYSPSNDETKTFLISYTLKNVVTKYNDTAELYWKYIGTENVTPIRNFKVNVKLPEGAKKEELKIWGHGPLNGITNIIDYRSLDLGVTSLPTKTFVEARILFPTKIVPSSKRVIKEDALERILSEEKTWAEEANRIRESARKKLLYGKLTGISLSILAVLIAIFVQFKYGREFPPQFAGDYYRELPKDYTPAVMSVLMNWGKTDPKDITATLMDLIRKKYLKLELETVQVKKFFGKKDKEIYTITKYKDIDQKLLSHEIFFIDWMIGKIGNGFKVTFDDIKSYSKNRGKAQGFLSDYNTWKSTVKRDAEQFKFFDKKADTGKIIGVLSGVLIIILSIVSVFFFNSLMPIISIIFGIILIPISSFIRRRTQDGSTQFKMWNAFKKFLRDFSSMKDVSVPSLIIWEHYLVYAISLDVAKKVIKQLKVTIPEEEFRNNNLTYLYMANSMNSYYALETFETISHDFEDITNSVVKTAQTSNSSSSGGGGGFSGGGGGGGGGGGAGGF